jgi:hypothetical protein
MLFLGHEMVLGVAMKITQLERFTTSGATKSFMQFATEN